MRVDDEDRTKVSLVDPVVGTVIADRYRIEMRLAAGGFGAIYRALDLVDDRDVAVKLLHPRLTSDRAVIARFRREGAALAQLRDPHTVTAYEIGETRQGALYIVMELLEGSSLHDHFRELGPMPWRRVVRIARAVCSSLAEAHALGIIHRDLKPANIHLETRGDERDYVKVLDFGIAKIIHGGALDSSDLTSVGQMIGTFDYMPVEQMVGGECTAQSDLFTLGVVMYEMISGSRPYGEAPSAAGMLTQLLTINPEPLAVRSDAPLELDRIVMRCLDRTAANRYPTASQLAADLEQLVVADAKAQAAKDPTAGTPTSQDDTISEELTWFDTPVKLPSVTLPGIVPPRRRR